MSRGMPVEIGAQTFSTKSAASNAIREILNNTPLGDMILGEPYDFIYHLLLQHPRAQAKIGRGVASISVEMSDRGNRCFWIHRLDGSKVDFSYQLALSGSRSHRSEILHAMRHEVAPQVIEFRNRYFSTHANNSSRAPCQLTGTYILMNESHVDHIIRFIDLADSFVNPLGGYSVIEYVRADVGSDSRLKDHNIAQQWQLWHKQHAQLRVISARANLTRRRQS